MLQYIDLNIITREHILGSWYVSSRSLPASGSGNGNGIFSRINSLEIHPGGFSADNGSITGEVQLIRENKIIYNPQVKFLTTNETASAIITRLTKEEHGERDLQKLTLYFSNGLELILFKN